MLRNIFRMKQVLQQTTPWSYSFKIFNANDTTSPKKKLQKNAQSRFRHINYMFPCTVANFRVKIHFQLGISYVLSIQNFHNIYIHLYALVNNTVTISCG